MFNLGFRTRRAENAPQIKRDLQLAVLADITSARHGIGTVSAAYDKLYDEIARRMPRGVTFAVTSAERAEGRTSIAASLACAAVRHGKKVLLIDADLRHPQVHDLFAHTGLSVAPGLVEMLVGNLNSPSDAVHETSIPGLYIVPAGRMQVSDASALLESPTMQRMLKTHLPQLADIIIVDTPPVHAGEPGSKIIHQADGVIVALRVGHSQMPTCKNVLSSLQRSGARVIGGVLVPAGEPNTGPVLAHVETPSDIPAVNISHEPDVSLPSDHESSVDDQIPVIRIVAGPPQAAEPAADELASTVDDVLDGSSPGEVSDSIQESDVPVVVMEETDTPVDVEDMSVDDEIEDVVWVSTNGTMPQDSVVTFGDDAGHRETESHTDETGDATVDVLDVVVDDTSGGAVPAENSVEQDETTPMDETSGSSGLPADKLSELLATWRRGAYEVAIGQPVLPDAESHDVSGEFIEVITPETDHAPSTSGSTESNTPERIQLEHTSQGQPSEPEFIIDRGCGIEALEVTFSMVPTGASEMTLRAESTNHGELGCLPIHLEMAMLVSAMRGMQAETPGPDATDGLRALLETKSSSANDNTALRLRVGSLDAPRIDATLHADGICHVRAGETRGDTQVSISTPDGGTSSIIATTSLEPMVGRAVITLEREVLRRPYGDVRFINRIRLQLMK